MKEIESVVKSLGALTISNMGGKGKEPVEEKKRKEK